MLRGVGHGLYLEALLLRHIVGRGSHERAGAFRHARRGLLAAARHVPQVFFPARYGTAFVVLALNGLNLATQVRPQLTPCCRAPSGGGASAAHPAGQAGRGAMDPFLQVNDVLPGADGAKKSSMPKSEPKLSITELVSKARKQSKIEEQDNEDDERERRESNRQHDMLHDITAHEGHSHAVFCVAFHPEGRLLLSASGDKTVKLWDLQTHRVLTTFTEHEQWVYSVAFFHNTMAFATGCDDGRVRVYENKTDPINHETGWNLECDLGQGGKHDPANGHRAGVQSVDVSRDDAYVVSASADTTIKVRALTLTPTPLEPQAAPWPLCGAGAGRE